MSRESSLLPQAAFLELRVVPNASRARLAGFHGAALKVRLRAPAVEGKANAALLAFLAAELGLRERALALVSGEKARGKRLAVSGVAPEELARRIEERLAQLSPRGAVQGRT
jgi:uncharacterized protein (TIGR00251 family)